MYVALRELKAAWGRFTLVGVVIGLVALLTTLLSGLANGLVDDGISGLRQLPMTHLAFQEGADNTFSRSTLTEADLKKWDGKSGVEASALGVSFVNARAASGTTVDVALFGIPEDSFLTPSKDADIFRSSAPGLVMSEEFAAEGIKVGDELTIVGVDEKLPVLAFVPAGSYGHVDIAYTQLTTWQDLLYGSNAKGRFSAIALRADSPRADLPTVPGTEVVTKKASYSGSPGYSGETQTMTMIRGFLLVISALVVGAFFVVWTIQRSGQIALMKALGASRWYVARDAVGQLGTVLVLASAAGGLVAFGLGALVETTAVPFRLEIGPALASLGALIVIGLLGCLGGIRRVTAVDPAMALRGTP